MYTLEALYRRALRLFEEGDLHSAIGPINIFLRHMDGDLFVEDIHAVHTALVVMRQQLFIMNEEDDRDRAGRKRFRY